MIKHIFSLTGHCERGGNFCCPFLWPLARKPSACIAYEPCPDNNSVSNEEERWTLNKYNLKGKQQLLTCFENLSWFEWKKKLFVNIFLLCGLIETTYRYYSNSGNFIYWLSNLRPFYLYSYFFYLPFSGNSLCVRTVDTVMYHHIWHSPAM